MEGQKAWEVCNILNEWDLRLVKVYVFLSEFRDALSNPDKYICIKPQLVEDVESVTQVRSYCMRDNSVGRRQST